MVKKKQNGRTRNWNVGQLYEHEESIHEESKRKQTRINGKFNLQLEKYSTLYPSKFFSILAQVLFSLKQGKNFALVKSVFPASITQFKPSKN